MNSLHQKLVCPIQFLYILVCLDHSDILGNLTTSILWKDVALLDLKVYIYKCYSNILCHTMLHGTTLESHLLFYVHTCGTVCCVFTL